MAVRSIKPRGKNIGIFSSSNEARRASSHGKAIRRLARTFGVGPNEKRLFNELTTGEQRRILIENKVIEPVKTRRQRITESLRKIVRRPKETPPHLLRYRATSKTKYRYPFDVMLEKGV